MNVKRIQHAWENKTIRTTISVSFLARGWRLWDHKQMLISLSIFDNTHILYVVLHTHRRHQSNSRRSARLCGRSSWVAPVGARYLPCWSMTNMHARTEFTSDERAAAWRADTAGARLVCCSVLSLSLSALLSILLFITLFVCRRSILAYTTYSR